MQFLPQDVAFSVASFLQDTDLCLLGSCSRFWRELCASDFIWFSLSKRRWPSIDISSEVHLADGGDDEVTKGAGFPHKVGRNFYIKWHKVMANRATRIVDFVKQHSQSEDSHEGADYLRAVGELSSMELSFREIQLFLFDTKQNVLLNLIGLHYCLLCLGVPTEDLNQALSNYHISERLLSVRWWKLGRWFRGFRLRDESRPHRFSLGDLVSGEELRQGGSP